MLGYVDAVCAVTRSRFGAAESNVPILMDNMLCRGTEDALDHCNFNGWNNHGCTHREDAGVICEDCKPPMHACMINLYHQYLLKPGIQAAWYHEKVMHPSSCNV